MTTKKRGRPGNPNFLKWADAKVFVQQHNVQSSQKYISWHILNNIQVLPRYPYHHYNEWTTWGDFLNVYNGSFVKP